MSATIAAAESALSYRSVRVDNLEIFYRESGPKDGPTILLLHGLPSSSRMFQPLLESTLSEHYHLIAPDYPGFGHSSWPNPKEFAYTFDSLAKVIQDLADELHLSLREWMAPSPLVRLWGPRAQTTPQGGVVS